MHFTGQHLPRRNDEAIAVLSVDVVHKNCLGRIGNYLVCRIQVVTKSYDLAAGDSQIIRLSCKDPAIKPELIWQAPNPIVPVLLESRESRRFGTALRRPKTFHSRVSWSVGLSSFRVCLCCTVEAIVSTSTETFMGSCSRRACRRVQRLRQLRRPLGRPLNED